MVNQVETVIIGAGQAGLATSYYLSQHHRDHIVLEQAAQAANVWRNQRWDSFTFVTPNWSIRLPGAEYNGDDPNGFMPRAEIVQYFDRYVAQFRPPIRYNTRVTRVDQNSAGEGYRVITSDGELNARNVVIATGFYQESKIPALGSALRDVVQMTTTQYRNPQSLLPGAALVVGSGQSGCQIVEDLYLSGRTVYLCTGSAGRSVRRYRGKDVWDWLVPMGFFDRTPDMLPSPKLRLLGAPQLTGARGGHSLNLHQFARDGVQLLGRFESAQAGTISIGDDLLENLTRADKMEADMVKMIDGYIAKMGIAAPPEAVPVLRDGFDAKIIRELNLHDAGITSIVWAAGFKFDFSWVRPAALDAMGYPVQQRGVAEQPGLYFVGLPWLSKYKSGFLIGVGEDAAYVASHIAEKRK